jgi:diamine N-acetyltransferase
LHQHSIDLSDATLRQAVQGLFDNPERGRILVVARGQRVVGVAVLSFLWTLEHGGQAAWLDELYIEPDQRRLGIGRELVQVSMQAAAEAGCKTLDLEVEDGHEDATRLYQRLGFHRHRRTRWAIPLP